MYKNPVILIINYEYNNNIHDCNERNLIQSNLMDQICILIGILHHSFLFRDNIVLYVFPIQSDKKWK